MLMTRRGFLTGLLAAPAIILTPGLLMPVRKLWTPTLKDIYLNNAAAYLVSWTVENTGSATVTLSGVHWSDFYADTGNLVIRPGEVARWDHLTQKVSLRSLIEGKSSG